jgi:phage recombination protein Bet
MNQDFEKLERKAGELIKLERQMNAQAKINGNQSRFTAEQIGLIQRMVCKGASPDEFKLFMYYCERTGLDPLTRQIYAVMRKDKEGNKVMSVQTSIDGFRLIAERTGKYAGQVGPYWCGGDGVWQDAWLTKEPPAASKVGILRSDFKEPCWGVARYLAYVCPTPIWGKLGDTMIAKCSESMGLRKAFPQELSGLYAEEEMQQQQYNTDGQYQQPAVARNSAAVVVASTKAKKPPPPEPDEPASDIREIVDPEDVLRAIDGDLGAAMDLGSLDTIWEQVCVERTLTLNFPSDQATAQEIYEKHQKRVTK